MPRAALPLAQVGVVNLPQGIKALPRPGREDTVCCVFSLVLSAEPVATCTPAELPRYLSDDRLRRD